MFGSTGYGGSEFAGEEYRPQSVPPPMRFPPLVHPGLAISLSFHFPSRCTIQVIETGLSGSGQLVPSEGVPIVWLTNLPCRISPFTDGQPRDNERRSMTVLEQQSLRILKLNGRYPQIVPRQMQAVVDGTLYAIRGSEPDSEGAFTRLLLEIVAPRKVV